MIARQIFDRRGGGSRTPEQTAVWEFAGRAAHRLTVAAVLLAFASATGCSGKADPWKAARPPTYPAAGVVTFKGSPVEGATVVFQAESGNRAATALTGSDGRFVLRTFEPKDGAIAGRHVVTIDKTTEVIDKPSDPEAPLPPPKITRHLPAKYADGKKSGLTAEVTEKGPNEFSFALVD